MLMNGFNNAPIITAHGKSPEQLQIMGMLEYSNRGIDDYWEMVSFLEQWCLVRVYSLNMTCVISCTFQSEEHAFEINWNGSAPTDVWDGAEIMEGNTVKVPTTAYHLNAERHDALTSRINHFKTVHITQVLLYLTSSDLH